MSPFSISLVVFAYNEADTIKNVLLTIQQQFSNINCDYEIIFIDDGSTDRTYETAASLSLNHAQIIQNHKNIGIGATLKKAYNLASKSYICPIPGDGQFRTEELIFAINQGLISKNEILLFTRYNRVNYTLFRKLISYGQRLINFIFFKKFINDVNWVKVLPQNSVHSLGLKMNNLLLETELIVKLTHLGYKLREHPSYYCVRKHGVSKTCNLSEIMKALRSYPNLVKEIFYFKKKKTK